VADQAPFEANAQQQLREMIRIHRNHPSIIVWSMGNEVFFSAQAVMQQAKNLVKTMVAVEHVEDPTRPAAMGGTQRDGFDVLADVAGYNGDGATLYLNPGFPSMVAEYGSCKEDRPGAYNACWGVLQVGSDSPTQYAWRAGASIWCGFHHGSNLGASFGGMGMIDHARLPLERWYYYRNKFLGTPPPTWPTSGTAAKLQLTTDNNVIADDGRTDCQLIVQVQDASGKWINSAPAITLTDKSGLGLFPGGTTITFIGGAVDKGVLNGLAAIEYRSYTAGTAAIDATSSGLDRHRR
jgi:beta-galactosidase